ncbi:MAG: phosphate starvation-inducible protein PhoH, partial [Deltaproteobacteria bacterium]
MKSILPKKAGMASKKVAISDQEVFRHLCGEHNAHLKLMEDRIGVTLHVRGNVIILQGYIWEIDLAENVLTQLAELVKSKYPVYPSDVDYAIRILSNDPEMDLKKVFKDEILISSKKKLITPKSINQKRYIDGIRRYDIVFGIGPAGTGKTYLAMAMA